MYTRVWCALLFIYNVWSFTRDWNIFIGVCALISFAAYMYATHICRAAEEAKKFSDLVKDIEK